MRQNQKTSKQKIKNEVEEELRGFNPKKTSLFSKEDFSRLGVELTPKQHELYKLIRNNIFTIARGPAGSAKTFVACYTALGLLADKKIEKIIITKPIVESGETIGILPGDLSQKTDVYMKSYISTFQKILGKFLSDTLFASGIIEINFLAYMRGDTFDNSIMILDECQNVKMSQLMLWITRLGKDSKAIMCGDVSQYDIDHRDAKFLQFIKFCDGMNGVADFEFGREDIVRNKFLVELTDRYEKWKYTTNDGRKPIPEQQ
jgi:phosphate starvation-inducible PhoH-like protein